MRFFRVVGLLWMLGLLTVSNASGQTDTQSAVRPSSKPDAATQTEARFGVIALDDLGKPLHALAKDGLSVLLGGNAAEIEDIKSLEDEPLIFSLIVDTSGSTRLSANKQNTTAMQLFRALSTGRNRGYLILFNDDVRTEKQFATVQEVEKTLKEVEPRGSTALYDAIVKASTEQLSGKAVPPNARRAIFVFSDGSDNCSVNSLKRTLEIAQKEGIAIFSIKIRVDQERAKDSRREFGTLTALSKSTGGLVIEPRYHQDELGQLPNMLMGQFLLTVRTGELKRKRAYPLKVESGRKDVEVLAQTVYVAP
jgi:VWFA-related protein